MRQDEQSAIIGDFDTSLISQFFGEFQTFMDDANKVGDVDNLLTDLITLMDLQKSVTSGKAECSFQIGNYLVNSTALQTQFFNQSRALTQSQLQSLLLSTIPTGDILALLISSAQGINEEGIDPEVLGPQVREFVCEEQRINDLSQYPNGRELKNATQALCNLTQEDFNTLLADIQEDFNGTVFLDDLGKCSKRVTGNGITTNMDALGRGANVLKDFQKLSSLQNLLSAVNSTLVETVAAATDNKSRSNGNSDPLNFMGRLFCSRSELDIMPPVPNDEFDPRSAADSESGPLSKIGENRRRFRLDNETRNTTRKPIAFSAPPPANFCSNMVAMLEERVETRILWSQLKPLIRGKIPYSPDTPVVQRIIKEANRTFEQLSNLMKLADDWLLVSPKVYDYLATDPAVDVVRNLLKRLAPENRIAATYNRWLYNGPRIEGRYDWRSSWNYTNIMFKYLKAYLGCFEFDKFEGYESESALVKAGLNYMEDERLWAALVFDVPSDASEIPKHITYKIRMNTNRVDSTKKGKVLDKYWRPGPRAKPLPDMKYLVYGFAYLQDMVEHGIIRLQTGIKEFYGIEIQQFPYPCYTYDKFIFAISRTLPMFMVLAWIYTVSMTVKSIVYEKQQRLKEVMKAMGLSNGVHWLAWFITSFIMMTTAVVLLLLILKLGNVLAHTDALVLFLFLMSFTLATISLCFLVSTLFSHANLAAACAGVFYFLSYLPYTFTFRIEEDMVLYQKSLVSLISNVAFGYGCSYLARFEEQGIGSQWSNIGESPIPGDKYSLLGCIIMMLVDSMIYFLLTWYIEAVFPGQYGVPRPWYFPFTKSYWCGREISDNQDYGNTNYEMNTNQDTSEDFEKEPVQMGLGVSIRELRKVYSRGKKLAVDGLNLNFYEGQITSFLGHNGAGKTTTMSILMGIFPPTKGTAFIYGKDIRHDINHIRKSLGVCPQHNVLFDQLTVAEHLWFYGCMKGMTTEEVNAEMDNMIKDVGLPHKKHELSKNLSGGMKRKLSVAMAFVAGSRVVILDEPTAGVDPYARRSIWEMLLKYKEGRTIILSTHFMDEADILGDRIAIISHGKLCCCGSSLFLKSRFGSGYYLTLVKDEENKAEVDGDKFLENSHTSLRDVKPVCGSMDEGVADLDKSSNSGTNTSDSSQNAAFASGDSPLTARRVTVMENGFDEGRLTAFIKECLPDAVLMENIGSEICYQLPEEGARSGMFEKLFNDLNDNLSLLKISSYGISDTTLEEVFLRVADATGVDELPERVDELTDGGSMPRPVTRLSFRRKGRRQAEDKAILTSEEFLFGENEGSIDTSSDIDLKEAVKKCNGAGSHQVTGKKLILRQFWALWVKRFHNVRRSKKGFISEIILPAALILVALIFTRLNPTDPDMPPLELHPWLLTPKLADEARLTWFYSNDMPGEEWTDKIEKVLNERGGVGTRCMDSESHVIPGFPCIDVPTGQRLWTENIPAPNISEECSCGTGWSVCPEGAGGPAPSRRLLNTDDYLLNMTGRNITDWLVKTNEKYIKSRYGGISFGERNPLVKANSTEISLLIGNIIKAATRNGTAQDMNNPASNFSSTLEDVLSNLATSRNAKVWFNNKGYVAMVSYMNIMNNLILRAHLPSDADIREYGIAAVNHPMNRTQEQLEEYLMSAGLADLLTAISVIFALSFIPASFILFLIEERTSNAKHLQFVSGVNHSIYWIANFSWDIVNYCVPCILCIFIFIAFQQESFVSANNAPCLVTLLILYGLAVTPMMYPASFFFSVPSSAFVALSCLNVFLGIVSTVSTYILEVLSNDDPGLEKINDILKLVFLVLPHYCLGRGLMDMTNNQLQSNVLKLLGEDSFKNPFSWDVVGRNLVCLIAQIVIFFILTLLIEYRFFINKCRSFRKDVGSATDRGEDIDVARERQRVMSGAAMNDVLRIEELYKVYGKKSNKHPAVNRIALGVHAGECFGLLGVNGAGKTTTFKMLTGDEDTTSGDAHLAGFSILNDMTSVHQQLGYCPQFDAIFPLLTAREHLAFYARLRGVPEKDINTVVEWGVRKLGLLQHATRVAADYSGGNKRKLSTAIALVGNPPVMFLDEPTTGMDPKARRFLWNCITQILKDGRSVVLTSHSMEECEALCNRLAIMVNGSFKCLGSVQHLKDRFGEGYMIVIRCQTKSLTAIMEYMSDTFPEALLTEHHHNVLQYQINSGCEFSLANVFSCLESIRESHNIEDYSVSQTTLDQVFINFAKLQTDLLKDEIELGEESGDRNNDGVYSAGDRSMGGGIYMSSPNMTTVTAHGANEGPADTKPKPKSDDCPPKVSVC